MTQLSKKQQSILNHLINYCPIVKTKLHSSHCAAITIGGKIICTGRNNNRTKLSKCCLTSIHAEIDVLYKYFRNNYTPNSRLCLWVIRWNHKTCELRNSKPCISCLCAIRKFNIKRIYFSTNEGIVSMKPKDIVNTYTTRAQKHHECIEQKWSIFVSH
jgi:tRNA(Arg) A34 adenosine deaminase TadA